ncbi:ABC transporter permease [Arthrobacter sp. D1-29]
MLLRLILNRLLSMAPVLLLVSFAVFMLIALIPGDPAVTLAGGDNASPESIAAVRERLNMDEPLIVQYLIWLGGIIRLDLGTSLLSGQNIAAEIAARLPFTLSLTLAAAVVAILVAIPLGVLSGMWPGGRLDEGVRLVASAGIAVPNFWLAVMLVSLFGVQLRLFPPTGYVLPSQSFGGWLETVTLPAIALGVVVSANLARQLRRSLIEVLDSNYIRTAWAKGAGSARVVGVHALKNAAIPAVTVFGVQLGNLLGGAIIIESIFAIPGLGTYMLQAISSQDLPVVQGVVLIFVVFQLVLSLLVDISYGYLNPKVRIA